MRAVLIMLAVTVAILAGVAGVVQMSRPPASEVLGTVTVEDGDTLWEIGGDLAGAHDRRDWVARTCELNGWLVAPVLRIGTVCTVPDWRE